MIATLATLAALTAPQFRILVRAMNYWAGTAQWAPADVRAIVANLAQRLDLGSEGTDLAIVHVFAPIALDLILGDKRDEATLRRAYARLGVEFPEASITQEDTDRACEHIRALANGTPWPPPPPAPPESKINHENCPPGSHIREGGEIHCIRRDVSAPSAPPRVEIPAQGSGSTHK